MWSFYNDEERIAYVGWLLACDSSINVTKGHALLKKLDGNDRAAALVHADDLIKLYNEG